MKMRHFSTLFLVLSVIILPLVSAQAQEKNVTGFFYPTGSSNFGYGYLGWLGYNSAYYPWHLAQDMKAAYDGPVYAVDDGKVVMPRADVGGYGGFYSDGTVRPGGGFIVQSTTRSGRTYYMLYGHIKTDTLPLNGTRVIAGTIIARVGHYFYADGTDVPHIHSGCMPDSLPVNPWAGYTSDKHGDHKGFVNPWHDITIDGHFYQGFLDNNQPSGGDPGTDIYVSTSGNDSNNGSSGSPYRTVKHAVDNASSSQAVTIHIAPGTYGEKVSTSKHIHFVTWGSGTVRIGG